MKNRILTLAILICCLCTQSELVSAQNKTSVDPADFPSVMEACSKALREQGSFDVNSPTSIRRADECFAAHGFTPEVFMELSENPGPAISRMGVVTTSLSSPVPLPDKAALMHSLQGKQPAAATEPKAVEAAETAEAVETSEDDDVTQDAAPRSPRGVYLPSGNTNKKESGGAKPVFLGR